MRKWEIEIGANCYDVTYGATTLNGTNFLSFEDSIMAVSLIYNKSMELSETYDIDLLKYLKFNSSDVDDDQLCLS